MRTLGPNRTQRQTADGGLLEWELLFPVGSLHGGRMPFFIDWLECTNPRLTTPPGGALKSVAVTAPDADDLRGALTSIELDVAVVAGEPQFNVVIEGPRGEITLSDTQETRGVGLSWGR